jgi:hypothetical protein
MTVNVSEYAMSLINEAVQDEFYKASEKFNKFNSAHEGFAVLKEEVDELWEAVKLNKTKHPDRNDLMLKEAIQVTAMGLRFLHDVCFEKEES